MEIKGYNTAIECLNAFFGISSVEELHEANEVSLFADTLEDITEKGRWSWMDNSGTTHYWFVKEENKSSLPFLMELIRHNEVMPLARNPFVDILAILIPTALCSILPM